MGTYTYSDTDFSQKGRRVPLRENPQCLSSTHRSPWRAMEKKDDGGGRARFVTPDALPIAKGFRPISVMSISL